MATGAVLFGVLAAPAISATDGRPFATSMNRICLAGTKRANAIGQVQSLGDLATLGTRLIAVDKWELHRILALGPPPPSIASYVNQFVAAQRTINSLGAQAVSAAKRGDGAGAERIATRSDALSRVQEIAARRIGASACMPSNGAR
jgi:hypothetical protein